MYPTVVIVLVETQRSMADVCEISLSATSSLAGPVASEPRLATIGDPPFAAAPLLTTTDNEAESQCSRTPESQVVQAGAWLGEGHSRRKLVSGSRH